MRNNKSALGATFYGYELYVPVIGKIPLSLKAWRWPGRVVRIPPVLSSEQDIALLFCTFIFWVSRKQYCYQSYTWDGSDPYYGPYWKSPLESTLVRIRLLWTHWMIPTSAIERKFCSLMVFKMVFAILNLTFITFITFIISAFITEDILKHTKVPFIPNSGKLIILVQGEVPCFMFITWRFCVYIYTYVCVYGMMIHVALQASPFS